MTNDLISSLLSKDLENAPLWAGDYKIPWNSPEFSKRMLREHLSQEHDLASRNLQAIASQAAWIAGRCLPEIKGSILDLGCGPGLYAPHLIAAGRRYLGIDFGPASVAYATKRFARPDRCSFVLGDIRDTPFDGPHDLAMLLYGECNVFPPDEIARILSRAFEALKPGGRLLLEVHTFEAVKALGEGQAWFAAEAGLFMDSPHLCLTKNQWFEDEESSRQLFYVISDADPKLVTMQSTVKAWTRTGYLRLLQAAGFTDCEFQDDWPCGRKEFLVVTARRG